VPQEDAHATVLQLEADGRTALFGVFDGHGGKQVAKYVAQHLVRPRPAPTCARPAGPAGQAGGGAGAQGGAGAALPGQKSRVRTC
jgi:hypothetical protein